MAVQCSAVQMAVTWQWHSCRWCTSRPSPWWPRTRPWSLAGPWGGSYSLLVYQEVSGARTHQSRQGPSSQGLQGVNPPPITLPSQGGLFASPRPKPKGFKGFLGTKKSQIMQFLCVWGDSQIQVYRDLGFEWGILRYSLC